MKIPLSYLSQAKIIHRIAKPIHSQDLTTLQALKKNDIYLHKIEILIKKLNTTIMS